MFRERPPSRFGPATSRSSRSRPPPGKPRSRPRPPRCACSAACGRGASGGARTSRREARILASLVRRPVARRSLGLTCPLADRGAGPRRERSYGAWPHPKHPTGLLGGEADVARQEDGGALIGGEIAERPHDQVAILN